jgi:hypothetical protein
MIVLTVLATTPRKTPVEFLPPWLIFAVIAVFAVVIVYVAARQRRLRREGLAQFALESGFLFSEEPDAATAEELGHIHIAPAAFEERGRYSNVLRGSAGGIDAIVADRTVGGGKSQSTSTIVAFKNSTPIPAFMLCGENVLWHIAEKLGYSDIDIDGAPDFSRRFFLHGPDPAAIRDLFKPEVTQAFEQIDPDKPPYVSASGPWLIIYYPGRIIAPAELRDFLQKAASIAGAFRRAQEHSAFR